MSALLERLREALAPQLRVERELGGGAMGVVFLGHDLTLDRPVAIKVLRPELATAAAAERFLAESRILARLRHHNLMTVHQAGEAGGLLYYVMEYLTGETLHDRMVRSRLSRAEALKLGRDLLDGLEAAHRAGVIHRDVKPANVLLQAGRAVLFDFGIARLPGSGPHRPGSLIGTPAYMSPEQREGNEATAQSDLYCAAVVLYEAFTSRLYRPGGSWDGVPRDVARVLQRALADDPSVRWPDARSFRRALWRTRARPYVVRTGALTALGLAVGATFGVFAGRAPAEVIPPADLVIDPFEVESGLDPGIGAGLAHLATLNLEGVPGFAVGRVPPARRSARGRLAAENGSLVLRMSLVDSAGASAPITAVRGTTDDLAAFGYAAALALLRVAAPGAVTSYAGLGGLNNRSVQAIRAFLAGEAAFQRDAWAAADAAYRRALDLDSGFAIARWRLANVIRWRRLPQEVDLAALYRDHGAGLGELDRLLLEAELAPRGAERFAKYELALQRYPVDGYAALLYGAELMHRGALAGVPLESAVTVLQRAARYDGYSARTQSHLSWALIRLGRQAEARAALDQLARSAARSPEADFDIPAFLELGYAERFDPDRAALVRAALVSQPATVRAALARAIRWSASFDVPQTQVALAPSLGEGAEVEQARGLGLYGLGRLNEGLLSLEQAARGFGTPEAALEAAEWRVIPPAVGVPDPGRDAGRAAESALEQLAGRPSTRGRAAWALALRALSRGDSAGARRWRERIPPDSASRPLVELLKSIEEAAAGRFREALATSDPLTALPEQPDPFFRAVLRLNRGDWLSRLGDRAADREWRSYQHMDLVGWPTGLAQPGEVDWALSGEFRLRGAMVAAAREDRATACSLLLRVDQLWAGADPPVRARLDSARAVSRVTCP